MNKSDYKELEFYRSMLKSVNGFMYTLNMDPYGVSWVSDNDIVSQLSGSTAQRIIENGAFIPRKLPEEPDFQESVINTITAFQKTPERKWGGTFRFQHADGSKKWIAYTSATLSKDQDGKADKIACMAIPIDSLFNTPKSMKDVLTYSSKKLYDVEIESLTKRQKEILKMIGHGMIRKEMASKLQLSITTIDDHKKSLFKKFNCNRLSDLAMVAQKIGLNSP